MGEPIEATSSMKCRASPVDNSSWEAQSVEEPLQCKQERLHLEVSSHAIIRGGFTNDDMTLDTSFKCV
jgi:hypothetical protein